MKIYESFRENVRLISPEASYPLRFSILRPHQPIATCHYPDDHAYRSLLKGKNH